MQSLKGGHFCVRTMMLSSTVFDGYFSLGRPLTIVHKTPNAFRAENTIMRKLQVSRTAHLAKRSDIEVHVCNFYEGKKSASNKVTNIMNIS